MRAAADAWAVWTTACREIAACQNDLLARLLGGFAGYADPGVNGARSLQHPAAHLAATKGGYEALAHTTREIHDIATRCCFELAERAVRGAVEKQATLARALGIGFAGASRAEATAAEPEPATAPPDGREEAIPWHGGSPPSPPG
jgi:hypothetical protein